MALPYEHSADQKPAGDFVEGTFRRAYPKSFPPGVSAVAGVHKETAGSGRSDANARQLQAVRFDSSAFTAAEARSWLSKNGYDSSRFEAATEPGKR